MWTFFDEIFADLASHYTLQTFQPKRYRFPLLHNRLNRWKYQYEMRSVLRNNDVCFFEWASELLVQASHLPKSCAMVTRLHSFELYEWAPKVNWQTVDKVILVSHAMHELFCELYPDHAHKAVVIYNGRSLDAFQPPAHRDFTFTLGMLCNVLPVKRVYEAVLMVHGLVTEGYPARLRIAGDIERDQRYVVAIRRLVAKLHLQEHVLLDGPVTDAPNWLQQIDIFLSNSYWEGQQVALLEAMASGCYCLAHHWAGAEEMLPGETLFLTEAELQEKIVAYSRISDGERLACQHKLRRIACEKFNIERTSAQIRTVLDALL